MQVSYVRGGLKESLHALRLDGVHPPLDGLVTWAAYHAGGGRERVLRLVPALWTALAGLAVFVIAGGPRRPVRSLGAALFLAATPLSVYLGQEVRPYALALLLVAASFAFFEDPSALSKDGPFRAGLVACALASATLYLAVLPLAVLWAGLLRRATGGGARREIRRAILLPLPALATLGLWLGWVRASLSHPGESFPVDLSGPRLASLFNGLLGWREEGTRLFAGTPVAAALVLVGVGLSIRRREGLHVLSLAVTTLGAIALLASAQHWISLRYLSLALVPLAVLFGSGLELVSRGRPLLAVAVAIPFLVLHVPSWREISRSARPDWRQVATYLSWQRDHGRGGAILGLDDWSYLCLRAQPPVAADVAGFVTPESAAAALGGAGWLVRAPHARSTADPAPVTRGEKPWATFPEAQDAQLFRFEHGAVTGP